VSGENKIVVAVKGIVINKGKMLITKRAENDEVGGGTWECPGGKIEFGEELEAALVREIKEEAGIDVTVDRILFAVTFKTNPARQVVVINYLCSSQNTDVALSDEHMDYKWATKCEARQFLLPEIIRDFEKNNIFSLEELS
jgi:8-oxo-dGTP diphosphatase